MTGSATDKVRGKVVVITGASSGFGKGTAMALAPRGAHLILAARREDALHTIARECQSAGANAVPICTDVAVRSDIAIRQRETAEQAGLDRKARLRNLTGAFAAVARLHARHVAILDDVVTTGSTVRELANVLRRAGAEQIEVWAIARTELTG